MLRASDHVYHGMLDLRVYAAYLTSADAVPQTIHHDDCRCLMVAQSAMTCSNTTSDKLGWLISGCRACRNAYA